MIQLQFLDFLLLKKGLKQDTVGISLLSMLKTSGTYDTLAIFKSLLLEEGPEHDTVGIFPNFNITWVGPIKLL